MPAISVIIPTYNRPALEPVLRALRHQSCQDFEVVVVDDGGSDQTRELVGQLAHEGLLPPDALHYAWQEDRGMRAARARNLGARIARGQHYLFLDSDVVLHPGTLAAALELLAAEPLTYVLGEYRYLPQGTPSDPTAAPGWVQGLDGVAGAFDVRDTVGQSYLFSEQVLRPPTTGVAVGLACLGGLSAISAVAYSLSGGYDEWFVGHGGEDGEFGVRALKSGLGLCFSRRLRGYHLWHPRPTSYNTEAAIAYINSKHPELSAADHRR